jgi:vacuolar-type H+-ATPase subunit H
VEDIKLHQETIATDSNSPLHQIREKELEISGRVLTAKRQADEIIAAARKKAAEVMAAAEREGGAGAEETELAIKAEATVEAQRLRDAAAEEARALNEQVEARRTQAVRMVMDEVTSI